MTVHRLPTIILLLTVMTHEPTPAQRATPRLTIADAVSLALDHHPQLGIASADATAARAALGATRAEWLPSLRVEVAGTRFQEPMIVSPLHAFDPAAPPSFNRTLVQSQWTLAYTLFDGGGRGARVARENAAVHAQESARDAARTEVIERVIAAYLDVLTTARIDSAQAARVRALEAELERANQLFDEGRAPRVDVLRARAALAGARADRVQTAGAYRTALAELSRQAAIPDSLVERTTLGRVSASSPPQSREAIGAAARSHNSTLDQARHQLTAREAGIRAARSAWFPDLSLRGGLVTYGSADGELTAEWQGSVAISYPLFTGGARSNAISRARAMADAAAAAVRAAELDIASRADRALTTWETQDAQREALDEVVVHLREVVRIEQLALDVGTGVQTDYLRAEAELFEARAGLARAQSGVIRARVALARLTGELTLDWVHDHLETEQ